MEKSYTKCARKASPRTLFYFVKQSKTVIERALSKPLKLTFFFFRIQSLLMDKVIKNKRDLELVTSRSSGYETSSQKFL